jgi:hypothetical protein
MKTLLQEELPYQILSVVLALELLTLVALSPRTSGFEPLGFHAISSLRFVGLMALGAVLYQHPPRVAIVALGLWAIILFPPELWAFSLEAREGFPLTLFSSTLAGFGAFAFAKLLPNASQVFPMLGVLALFINGFQPSLYSTPLLLLFASSMLMLLVLFFKKLSLQGVS